MNIIYLRECNRKMKAVNLKRIAWGETLATTLLEPNFPEYGLIFLPKRKNSWIERGSNTLPLRHIMARLYGSIQIQNWNRLTDLNVRNANVWHERTAMPVSLTDTDNSSTGLSTWIASLYLTQDKNLKFRWFKYENCWFLNMFMKKM